MFLQGGVGTVLRNEVVFIQFLGQNVLIQKKDFKENILCVFVGLLIPLHGGYFVAYLLTFCQLLHRLYSNGMCD